MKLVIVIVQDQDAITLQDDLTEKGFRVTKLASTGGFLKSGNTTFLIGVDESKMQELLSIIETDCKSRQTSTSMLSVSMPGDAYIPYPVEIVIGGATIFVLDVEEFVRF